MFAFVLLAVFILFVVTLGVHGVYLYFATVTVSGVALVMYGAWSRMVGRD